VAKKEIQVCYEKLKKFEIPANFRSALAHNDQLNRRRNKGRRRGGSRVKRRSLIVRPTVSSGQSGPGRYLGSVSVYPPGPRSKTRAKIG